MKINYKILDNRITPDMLRPATPGSAGIDLCACVDEKITIKPGECVLIPSGIAIHIEDPQYAAFIFPRSGLGHKQGLVLGNLTGVIDSDYQGQIMVSAWNRNQNLSDCVIINPLDRIAQLVFMPVMRPNFELVESFEESVRGVGGLGSTDAN
jgi:dUTP pyrophosphatase